MPRALLHSLAATFPNFWTQELFPVASLACPRQLSRFVHQIASTFRLERKQLQIRSSLSNYKISLQISSPITSSHLRPLCSPLPPPSAPKTTKHPAISFRRNHPANLPQTFTFTISPQAPFASREDPCNTQATRASSKEVFRACIRRPAPRLPIACPHPPSRKISTSSAHTVTSASRLTPRLRACGQMLQCVRHYDSTARGVRTFVLL